MSNTVYGPYAPTAWVAGATALSQAHMNNLETQAADALNGLNGDLFASTGFVLSGILCTKDGTNANQLDVASGRAYALHSDGSLGLIVVGSTTFLTTVALATYYLDLNVDGSWSWGTSHSGMANYLTICNVTTDGSSNISVVNMQRQYQIDFLTQIAGFLNLPALGSIGGQAAVGSFGAPVIVAQSYRVHVTTTALKQIISWTTAAAGIYRVSVTGSIGNATPEKIILTGTYADTDLGVIGFTFTDATAHGGVANPPNFNTVPATTWGSTNLSTFPIVIAAGAGSQIVVNYTNPGGTPNDFVSAIIERLA